MPTQKRLLQAAVAIFALIPISAGLSGVLLGPAMTQEGAGGASLDSHFRYLSGLLLAIGLSFWGLIPRIERRAALFQALTFLVFTGGIGRLLSLIELGAPSAPMLGGLAMELVVTPALCLWQARIAAKALA